MGSSGGHSPLPPTPLFAVASHPALCTSLDVQVHAVVGHPLPWSAVYAAAKSATNPICIALALTTNHVSNVSADEDVERTTQKTTMCVDTKYVQ